VSALADAREVLDDLRAAVAAPDLTARQLDVISIYAGQAASALEQQLWQPGDAARTAREVAGELRALQADASARRDAITAAAHARDPHRLLPLPRRVITYAFGGPVITWEVRS
jgi:hypothetical protein